MKEKWLKITGYSQTTKKLVNEPANDSARVSGQDRKKPPALGTNQIAGFGGFRPLVSLGKIIFHIIAEYLLFFAKFRSPRIKNENVMTKSCL